MHRSIKSVKVIASREDRSRQGDGRSKEREHRASGSYSSRRDHHYSRRKRSRSPEQRRSKYDREDSRRSERGSRATEGSRGFKTTGSTPLFFAGNAKLKPFVPSDRKPLKKLGQTDDMQGSNAGESQMRIGSKNDDNFAFLKDDEDMREWEANEKELDR